jgi:hypothetical protein
MKDTAIKDIAIGQICFLKTNSKVSQSYKISPTSVMVRISGDITEHLLEHDLATCSLEGRNDQKDRKVRDRLRNDKEENGDPMYYEMLEIQTHSMTVHFYLDTNQFAIPNQEEYRLTSRSMTSGQHRFLKVVHQLHVELDLFRQAWLEAAKREVKPAVVLMPESAVKAIKEWGKPEVDPAMEAFYSDRLKKANEKPPSPLPKEVPFPLKGVYADNDIRLTKDREIYEKRIAGEIQAVVCFIEHLEKIGFETEKAKEALLSLKPHLRKLLKILRR